MRSATWIRAVVVTMVIATTSSCIVRGKNVDLPGAYILPDGHAPGPVLGERVWLVADNQFHYLYGTPTFLRRDLFDQFVNSAIRPPTLDLFARSLMTWMVGRYAPRAELLLHLGDIGDLSCRREFEDFASVVENQLWLVAPGNHDGFYYGNAYPTDEAALQGVFASTTDWVEACAGDARMDKGDFLRWYLASLASRGADARFERLADDRLQGALAGAATTSDGRIEPIFDDASTGFLRGLAWHIDDDPWSSWLVQVIDASASEDPTRSRRVVMLVLDTSSYQSAPQVVPVGAVNAGATGDIDEEQAAVVRAWAGKAYAAKAVIIVVGHHNYDDLTGRAKGLVDEIRRKYRSALYVSAHTHQGNWIVHGEQRKNKEGLDAWVELNVGSVLDSPIEMRSLTVLETRKYGAPRVAIDSELVRADDEMTACATHEAVGAPAPRSFWACTGGPQTVPWQALPEDPDYYTTYNRVIKATVDGTAMQLDDILLRAYQRYLRHVPTSTASWPQGLADDDQLCREIDVVVRSGDLAAKRTLMRQLDTFERSRTTHDEKLRKLYGACQGWWASRHDDMRGRKPSGVSVVLPEGF